MDYVDELDYWMVRELNMEVTLDLIVRRKMLIIHVRFVARTTIPVERMLQRH